MPRSSFAPFTQRSLTESREIPGGAKRGDHRRRILPEAGQLTRRFFEPDLRIVKSRSIPLLVCGDVNDGPGMEASEWKLAASGSGRA